MSEDQSALEDAERRAVAAIGDLLRLHRDSDAAYPPLPGAAEHLFTGSVRDALQRVGRACDRALEGFTRAGIPPIDPDSDPWP